MRFKSGLPYCKRGATLAERLDYYCRKGVDADRCWEWLGAQDRHGYGTITAKNRKRLVAHRVRWELAFGPIPKGKCVCHHCDNRRCTNPTHLYLASNAQNLADMASRGRTRNQHMIKTMGRSWSGPYEG